MKKLLVIIGLSLLLVSCSGIRQAEKSCKACAYIGAVAPCLPDTFVTVVYDTILDDRYKDSAYHYRLRADSLQQELYIALYKIERIDHYTSICKKESNKKFLYGWIRRVLGK